jgi:hypothetical protein
LIPSGLCQGTNRLGSPLQRQAAAFRAHVMGAEPIDRAPEEAANSRSYGRFERAHVG